MLINWKSWLYFSSKPQFNASTELLSNTICRSH